MLGMDQTCKRAAFRRVAIAVVLVSGALMLVPTVASAQIDIGGLMGAFGHRYGGGYHSGHSSSHHAKSHESSRSSDKDKDKEASDQDSSDQDVKGDGKASRRQTSAPAHDNSQSVATDTQPPAKVVPSKSNGDEPAFSPSR